jgi:Leucine-rich repeat (LRR) protein
MLAIGVRATTADPSSPSETTQWRQIITALGSDRYAERAAATKDLVEAGVDVIPIVVGAVGDDDPEVSSRAAFVLKLLARSKDPITNQAARRSLRMLSLSDDSRSARAAKRVLKSFADQAAQRLQLCGAKLKWDGLGQVSTVDLSNCKIDDDDLRPLKELRPLQLNLRHTSITDAGMEHLRDQSQLAELNLKATKVTDAGLKQLAGLKNLKTLSVERTRITDSGMAYLQKLQSLETLYLGESLVRGPGLEHLRGLPINYLSFQRSQVNDLVTRHLVALEQLRTLGLDETNVTDECIAPLTQLKELEVLWLNKTDVTDDCIADLLRLEGLMKLHVKGTKISPSGLERLEAARGEVKDGALPRSPRSRK